MLLINASIYRAPMIKKKTAHTAATTRIFGKVTGMYEKVMIVIADSRAKTNKKLVNLDIGFSFSTRTCLAVLLFPFRYSIALCRTPPQDRDTQMSY